MERRFSTSATLYGHPDCYVVLRRLKTSIPCKAVCNIFAIATELNGAGAGIYTDYFCDTSVAVNDVSVPWPSLQLVPSDK